MSIYVNKNKNWAVITFLAPKAPRSVRTMIAVSLRGLHATPGEKKCQILQALV